MLANTNIKILPRNISLRFVLFFFLVASFHKLLGEIGRGDRRFGRQKILGMFVGGICL